METTQPPTALTDDDLQYAYTLAHLRVEQCEERAEKCRELVERGRALDVGDTADLQHLVDIWEARASQAKEFAAKIARMQVARSLAVL